MRLDKLIEDLIWFSERHGDDCEVDVLLEANEPVKCQFQYAVTGIAYSPCDKKIVIMHEKWGPRAEGK